MKTNEFIRTPNMGIKQCPSYQYGFVREVKLSKKTSLEGYMHIYEYGMHQHLGSTNNIELGDCNDLFSPYFNNKLGFSCIIGMYALLLRYYASHFAKYLFQPQKLKREITDWLVEGDLHTLIIIMIYNHPHKGKFEEALRKLEFRIIGNSIRSGIKDVSFWKADYIMKKLIISNQELNEYLASISSPVKFDKKDPEIQNLVLVPSDKNMRANSLFMQVETEGVNERSNRGNNTYYINIGSIYYYNNCKFSFTQVNNYNENVFIKTEYKIPGDNFHAEQPNETNSHIRQSEPHLSMDDVPLETKTKTIPMEEQTLSEIKKDPKKVSTKRKRGRKPGFAYLKKNKSIFGLIDITLKTFKPQLKVNTSLLTTDIMSLLMDCQEDKAKAPLVVAMEVCEIIPILEGGKVKGFCELLCKEQENFVQYRTFFNHYKKYAPLRKRAKQQSQNSTNDVKLNDIIMWKNKINEKIKKRTQGEMSVDSPPCAKKS